MKILTLLITILSLFAYKPAFAEMPRILTPDKAVETKDNSFIGRVVRLDEIKRDESYVKARATVHVLNSKKEELNGSTVIVEYYSFSEIEGVFSIDFQISDSYLFAVSSVINGKVVYNSTASGKADQTFRIWPSTNRALSSPEQELTIKHVQFPKVMVKMTTKQLNNLITCKK